MQIETVHGECMPTRESSRHTGECSIVTPHTCRLTGVVGHHRNITSTFVAKKMYGVILDKMDYEPALIIRALTRISSM